MRNAQLEWRRSGRRCELGWRWLGPQFEGWYDTQSTSIARFVSTDGVAPRYVTFATPVCPQQLESTAYPVEANVSATGGYYLLSGTTCSRLDDASITMFAVGPALPNSMFQSATEDIE